MAMLTEKRRTAEDWRLGFRSLETELGDGWSTAGRAGRLSVRLIRPMSALTGAPE